MGAGEGEEPEDEGGGAKSSGTAPTPDGPEGDDFNADVNISVSRIS